MLRRKKLHGLLRELGLTRRYLGYDYLIYMLPLAAEDPAALDAPTKLLYPRAARHFHTTPEAVSAALRTACAVCWREGDPALTGRAGPGQIPPGAAAFLRRMTRLYSERLGAEEGSGAKFTLLLQTKKSD